MSNEQIVENFEKAFPVKFKHIHFNGVRYVADEPYYWSSDSEANQQNLRLEGWVAALEHNDARVKELEGLLKTRTETAKRKSKRIVVLTGRSRRLEGMLRRIDDKYQSMENESDNAELFSAIDEIKEVLGDE